ncbi:MAG: Circadian clock protein KaiB [Syntrophorhabdaceae bacterium PtaU1.Bin034]|jgi:circadian clock protein KaiB|nr:MAG: Circadian clock protein KaiB [Syntrophorhabdaceae bacterium PtaU1.Bin034]
MKKESPKDSVEIFEKAIKESRKKRYLLRLYIAGTSAKSTRAINNLKKLCEEHLKDRYELEVIDIYQQPKLAEGEQIIAAPTLVKELPPPLRKFIGDLADMEKLLVGLDLKPKANE